MSNQLEDPAVTTPRTRVDASGHAETGEKLRAITGELADAYWERGSVVRALVTALLAGQHSLLLGPPGTAMSQLARDLASRIDGARYWEILPGSSPTRSKAACRS